MVQFVTSSVLSACENLRSVVRFGTMVARRRASTKLTLLQPGNSQAWTRFPFLALLMRCVVGVYVIGRGMSAMVFERRIVSSELITACMFDVVEGDVAEVAVVAADVDRS